MFFSVNEAARRVTASKSTILRAINSGKLAAQRDGSTYRISEADLFRLFKPLVGGVKRTARDQPWDARDHEIALLKEMLVREQRRYDDLRIDRAAWVEHASELAKHLLRLKG